MDCLDEPIQLGRTSLSHQQDAAIGQVLNVAGHLKPRGNLAGGEAKAHTLDSAVIVNLTLLVGSIGCHVGQYSADEDLFPAATNLAHKKLITGPVVLPKL